MHGVQVEEGIPTCSMHRARGRQHGRRLGGPQAGAHCLQIHRAPAIDAPPSRPRRPCPAGALDLRLGRARRRDPQATGRSAPRSRGPPATSQARQSRPAERGGLQGAAAAAAAPRGAVVTRPLLRAGGPRPSSHVTPDPPARARTCRYVSSQKHVPSWCARALFARALHWRASIAPVRCGGAANTCACPQTHRERENCGEDRFGVCACLHCGVLDDSLGYP